MQNKLPDNRPKLMSNTMPGKMSIECQGRYELPENMPGKMWDRLSEEVFETKVPTIWTDKKHSQEEAEPGRNSDSDVEKVSREKIRDGESQKREDAAARKGRKVAKRCVFPGFCGSEGSKSRLAKAAGAERAGQMKDEQLHAVLVRSTFGSQNVQNTSGSDHFWKWRCRKSAHCWGAKHVLDQNAKHWGFWANFGVSISKLN